MGLFKSLFSNAKQSADELLATGELNWRLKPEILATKDFPKFNKFITKLEDENDIQFGLHNDISDESGTVLILRQPIYNENNLPVFTFSITFLYIPIVNVIMFTGMITNFHNPKELSDPKREHLVQLNTNKEIDLEIEEYEKYYWELLKQSLSVKGISVNDYKIKGKKCAYKMLEESVREKYS